MESFLGRVAKSRVSEAELEESLSGGCDIVLRSTAESIEVFRPRSSAFVPSCDRSDAAAASPTGGGSSAWSTMFLLSIMTRSLRRRAVLECKRVRSWNGEPNRTGSPGSSLSSRGEEALDFAEVLSAGSR